MATKELLNLKSKLRYPPLAVTDLSDATGYSMQRETPFSTELTPEQRLGLVRELARCAKMDRAMGCMVGMAVGDSVGHPLEFLDVVDSGTGPSSYSLATHKYTRPFNKFSLEPGQWTDDCSMGLCLADSLLARGTFDGTDCRVRFWCWWFCGLNNAFRKCERRGSVALGGNISRSLYSMEPERPVTPAFNSGGQDSGNGSLMRLAAVPIAYCSDAATAAAVARASSLTTHPGAIAAEACAFVATAIARALHDERRDAETARAFFERIADDYLKIEVRPTTAQTSG